MQKTEPLVHGNYYHIYNCGINGVPLFRENKNYEYFLRLYDRYIEPVADTCAWCLMGNHFHFLLRIKEIEEIDVEKLYTADGVLNPVRSIKPLHLYFSHLFNSYTQAFNKMYSRHGSLFERAFKRKRINSEKYFKQLVIYIHNNPVHHGFCKHPAEYPWSSYQTCISDRATKIEPNIVTEWFDSLDNFKAVHETEAGFSDMDKYLGL
jgi:putative transposase